MASKKGWNIRLFSWFPWVAFAWLGISLSAQTSDFSAGLIPLILYVLISYPLGLVVCFFYRNDPIGFLIAAVILFGGPPFSLVVRGMEADRWEARKIESQQKIAEYCEAYAGETIYQTASNVEGLFLLYQPFQPLSKKGNQYTFPAPWLESQLHRAAQYFLNTGGNGYWFIEQLTVGERQDTQYLRTYLQYTQQRKLEDTGKYPNSNFGRFRNISELVDSTQSLYGLRIEDLTTEEMRHHWISGGRLEIVNLKTNEVLAEHTGFMRAQGSQQRGQSWQKAELNGSDFCDESFIFEPFLHRVLQPKKDLPSKERLESLESKAPK